MAPKTKIFKNCVIAYTEDFPLSKREQIKAWIQHAGGSVSKEVTDSVTHIILTKKDWNEYQPKGKPSHHV